MRSMSQSNLPNLISISLTEKVGHMGQDANCLFYTVINIPQTVLYGRCVATMTKFILQIYIYIPIRLDFLAPNTEKRLMCCMSLRHE